MKARNVYVPFAFSAALIAAHAQGADATDVAARTAAAPDPATVLNPQIGAWRVGSVIYQGVTADGHLVRLVLSDFGSNALQWRMESSGDQGTTWHLEQDLHAESVARHSALHWSTQIGRGMLPTRD